MLPTLPTPSTSPFFNWLSRSFFLSLVGRSHQGIFRGWNGIVPRKLHSEFGEAGEVELRGSLTHQAVGLRWESGERDRLDLSRGEVSFIVSFHQGFQRIVGTFKVPGTRSWSAGREESFSCARILALNPFMYPAFSPLFLFFSFLSSGRFLVGWMDACEWVSDFFGKSVVVELVKFGWLRRWCFF